MKLFAAIALITGSLYLSSCSKDSSVTGVSLNAKTDSVSKNGYLQISFAGKTFRIADLEVKHAPVYTLYSNTMSFDQNDTLFINHILLKDYSYKTIALDMTCYNNTTGMPVGTYMITTNAGTFTDYSEGRNKVYGISTGSYIDITRTTYTTEGTMSLNLYYDHHNYPATGSFKIYN